MINVPGTQDDLTPLQRKLRGIQDPAPAPRESAVPDTADKLRLGSFLAPKKPDESARVLRTASRLGVDRDLVATNLEEAERIAQEKDFDPDKIRKTPVYAKWVSQSPHYMAVTKPDIEKLQDLERVYYRRDDPLRPLSEEEFESMAQRIGKRQGQAAMRADRSRVGLDPFTPNLFKTQQEAIEIYTQRARESLREQEDYVTGHGKAGAFDAPGSVMRKIPGAGVGVDLAEASLLSSMQRIEKGNPTEEDEDAVFLFGRMHAAAAARGQTFGGKVLEGVAALPGFAAEFAMTGGVYRAGKVGAQMALRRSLQKVLVGRAGSLVRKSLGVVAGGVAQTAAQTTFGSLPADALKRMAPGIEITPDEEGGLRASIEGPGEDILPAISKAFGARFVENLAERSGVGLSKILAPAKAAIAARWFKLNPGKTVTNFLSKVSKETGWNGVAEEVFEERVGELGRAALGIEEYKPPTAEDLFTEALTFAVPGAAAGAIRAGASVKRARQNREFFSTIQKTVREAESAKLAPEALEDLIGRFAEKGGSDFAYLPAEAWATEMGKLGKNAKQEAVALGATEASFDRAIRTRGNLQLPMAPFAVRVLAEPHGDAFIKLARTEPEEDTLPDAESETSSAPKRAALAPVPSQAVAPAAPQETPSVTPAQAGISDATQEEAAFIEARSRQADQVLEDAAEGALDTFFPDLHMKAVERAKGSARQALVEKFTESIRRKRLTEYREERGGVRAEVEAEINERKEYVALSVLRRGTLPSGAPAAIEGLKISREAISLDFPALSEGSLPRGILSEKGSGAHPDEIADLLGYSSGSEMLMALIDAEYRFPRETLIEELTDARMAARSESIEDDPAKTHEEAMRAIHNTERSKLLVQDLKHLISGDFATFKKLARRIAGAAPRLEDVTKWAEAEVRKESFRTLHPGIFRQSAKAAHRNAIDAFLAGDFQTAFDQRLLELQNNELAIAAQDLQEQAGKIPKFMRKFQKRSVRESLAKAGAEKYLDPIDDILERFEFSPVSASKVEDRASFREWYEAEVKAGGSPVVPDKLLSDAYRMNWKDLKLSELLDIEKSAKNVAHLAKLKNTLLTAKEKREFDATVKELTTSIDLARGNRAPKREPLGELTAAERIRRKVAHGWASARKASNIALELDGWSQGGPVWETFIVPLNHAQELEQDMRIKGDAKLFKILSTYSRKDRRRMHRREYIPEIKDSLSMWDRVMVALNWGNESSREAVMLGYGWSEKNVDTILSSLSKRDWKVVEQIWEHVDTYWPETKALSERVDGVAPEKVDAEPFQVTTADGDSITLRGGYFPLKYKPDPSKPHDTIEEIVDQSMRGGTWRASTLHGHRKERVGSGGRKVRLDFGVLTEHQRDVIHDITHYEWLLDANKLLRNHSLVDAIKENVGAEMHDELLRTVNAVALNNRQTVDSIDRMSEWFARKTRGAVLVGSVATILKQYLGLAATTVRIGPIWTARGLWAAGFGTQQTRDVEAWMAEKSLFMKNRMGNQDRDQAEALRGAIQPGGEPGVVGEAFQRLERIGFNLIGATQWHVDRATWLGAYQRYSEELGIEKAGSTEERDKIEGRIVSMADQAVRDAQGSGLLADLPAVMRSRGVKRLLTIFQTFAVSQLNLFASKALPAAQRPSKATIAQAAAALVTLYVIPRVLWDMSKEALVGGGDDDEDGPGMTRKAAAGAVEEIMSSVPFARELAPSVGGMISGEGARMYSGPSGLMLIGEWAKLAGQLGQVAKEGEDQLDEPLLRSAWKSLALPASAQIDRTIRGYFAWEEGEANLPAILLGPPRRK